MEQYKIDFFNDVSQGMSFPAFSALPIDDCKQILQDISTSILNREYDKDFWQSLEQVMESETYSDEGIRLLDKVFLNHNFTCSEQVYIIWSATSIDKMESKALIEYWEDIWYPPADEYVIIYCAATMRLLMVTHLNTVYTN